MSEVGTEEGAKRLSARYNEYLELNYVKSQSDSEEEPYKTKYAARKLLQQTLAELDSFGLDALTDGNDGEETTTTTTSDETAVLVRHFCAKLEAVCRHKFKASARAFIVAKLLEFYMAKNLIETEEVEAGEKMVAAIVRQLDSLTSSSTPTSSSSSSSSSSDASSFNTHSLTYNPLLFNLMLSCFNELIFVWSSWSRYKQCIQCCDIIQEIYDVYKCEKTCAASLAPLEHAELILLMSSDWAVGRDQSSSASTKRRDAFEALYTHSLFFMAQVCGKMGESNKSAHYCQLTLQRQIDRHNEAVSEADAADSANQLVSASISEDVVFNPLEWATHAAALSQFYVCENDFATARHCLCCADAIINKLRQQHQQHTSSTISEEKLNEQIHSNRRCWVSFLSLQLFNCKINSNSNDHEQGKYALALLKESKSRLRRAANVANAADSTAQLIGDIDQVSQVHFKLPKALYKLDECEREAITSNIALDYEQARAIFLKAQLILNQARAFFQLDGYVTDHCEITRDLSDLYASLLFFEEDADRRCKMLKRRIDLLVPVCEQLNAQFYLSIKRQLLFDIGLAYSDLMDAKLDTLDEKMRGESAAAAAIAKINQLANKSLGHFEQFLDTMKVQPKRDRLPDKFDAHNVRSALFAKFYIGRLYSKLISAQPAVKLANIAKTMDNYNYLIAYCEKESKAGNDEPMSEMKVEYDLCKEMVHFLPAKMEKLRSSIV